MRIAVCDDCIRDQEQVVDVLHQYDPTIKAERFVSGSDLLEAAKEDPPFDVVFLDIYMPGENGIDVAHALQDISSTIGIIFVTTSRDHAIDAFSVGAVHYLVKPVTIEDVTVALNRLTRQRVVERPMMELTVGGNILTVYFDEINFIQSVNHAKELNMIDGKVIRVWTSMDELSLKLDQTFLKLNRSFIVNMEQIEQMGSDYCLLRDGTKLDFARRERAAIHAAYDNYLFDRLDAKPAWGGIRDEFLYSTCPWIFYSDWTWCAPLLSSI